MDMRLETWNAEILYNVGSLKIVASELEAHGRGEKMHTTFLLENLSRKDSSEDIRMDLRETGWEAVDWMHLVQDRDQ
jgi:hypothetical protein